MTQPLAHGDGALCFETPAVMGILNVTPDSFSDGGHLWDAGGVAVERAVERAAGMVADGADIIDIGGESTRPMADVVSVQEELDRVVPVIEAVRELGALVSVDTSKPEVMAAAIQAGAGMVNDVMALRRDGALEAAAAGGVAVCLMHMQGEPRTMQEDPVYHDVVEDVLAFLRAQVECCVSAGIRRDRIAIDPGFGFGKTASHNLMLLKELGRFSELGCPVLVGVSRKSTIGVLTGRSVAERMPGSLAAAAVAVMNGADIVRAHDVRETKDALAVAAAIKAGTG